MVLIRNWLKQRPGQRGIMMISLLLNVLTWLRSGWAEPKTALRFEQLYGFVILACGVFIAVKLTPFVQTMGQNVLQSLGQSLQNILNFTL